MAQATLSDFDSGTRCEAYQLRSAFDHTDQHAPALSANHRVEFPISDTRLFLNNGGALTDVHATGNRPGSAMDKVESCAKAPVATTAAPKMAIKIPTIDFVAPHVQ
jgi:hypothetical protein